MTSRLHKCVVKYSGLEIEEKCERFGAMFFGYRAKGREYVGGAVIGRLRGDSRRVLIQSSGFGEVGDRTWSVFKLDVYSGHRALVTASPAPGADFLTDENEEPRIATTFTADLKPRYFYRDRNESWKDLFALAGMTTRSEPIGFSASARTVYVVEPVAKGFGLFAVKIDGGERKLLSSNEWVPPARLLTDEKTGEVLAVEYEPDLPTYDFVAPDHPLSRVVKALLRAFPDENVAILNTTDDQKKAIALVYGARDPGRYMLVDVDKFSAEEMGGTRPWIDPEAGAEMTAFHIHTRDGAWIHGYVTLPKASRADDLPPLVVLPHGGPHFVRDTWVYDREVQLLASEGFAVLQVNYRGSGGYGSAYEEAGYRHWGDRIVQDIVDATRYALNKRYADPNRVCIYGGSFGGYAAMQSAIVAPELFRCAVGVAGIYDLGLMAREGDIPGTPLGRGYLRTVLGEDAEALSDASPARNADKLRARVLLIHGKKDRRAPFEHAERLKSALEERGRPPEWLVEPKEGHGFYDEEARERMYSRLVQFLRENTKAAAPSSASSDPGSRPGPAPLQPVPAAAPGR